MISVGAEVGALSVVLWTILGAILGVYLIRQQGVNTLQAAQTQMQSGSDLEESVFNGVFVFIGGILLMLPGLITDTFGLLLLFPPIRQVLLRKSLEGMKTRSFQFRHGAGPSNVFDGEFSEAQPRRPDVIEGTVMDDKKDKEK